MNLLYLVFFGALATEYLLRPNTQKDWLDWVIGLSALVIAGAELFMIALFLVMEF